MSLRDVRQVLYVMHSHYHTSTCSLLSTCIDFTRSTKDSLCQILHAESTLQRPPLPYHKALFINLPCVEHMKITSEANFLSLILFETVSTSSEELYRLLPHPGLLCGWCFLPSLLHHQHALFMWYYG